MGDVTSLTAAGFKVEADFSSANSDTESWSADGDDGGGGVWGDEWMLQITVHPKFTL